MIQVGSGDDEWQLQFFQFFRFQVTSQEIFKVAKLEQAHFGYYQFCQVLKFMPGKIIQDFMRFIAVRIKNACQRTGTDT